MRKPRTVHPTLTSRVHYLGLWLLSALACLAPAFMTRVLGALYGEARFAFSRRKRAALGRNLARAFPNLDQSELRRLGRASTRIEARARAEMLRLPQLSPRNFLKRIELENLSAFYEARNKGTGLILIYQRHGGWPFMLATLSFMLLPIAVADRFSPNPLKARWMRRQMTRSGCAILEDPDSTSEMLATLTNRRILALPLNYGAATPAEEDERVPVDLFGQAGTLPIRPARLARQSGAPIVIGHAPAGPRRNCRLRFDRPIRLTPDAPPHEELVRATEQIHRQIVRQIEAEPKCWPWNDRGALSDI